MWYVLIHAKCRAVKRSCPGTNIHQLKYSLTSEGKYITIMGAIVTSVFSPQFKNRDTKSVRQSATQHAKRMTLELSFAGGTVLLLIYIERQEFCISEGKETWRAAKQALLKKQIILFELSTSNSGRGSSQ